MGPIGRRWWSSFKSQVGILGCFNSGSKHCWGHSGVKALNHAADRLGLQSSAATAALARFRLQAPAKHMAMAGWYQY